MSQAPDSVALIGPNGPVVAALCTDIWPDAELSLHGDLYEDFDSICESGATVLLVDGGPLDLSDLGTLRLLLRRLRSGSDSTKRKRRSKTKAPPPALRALLFGLPEPFSEAKAALGAGAGALGFRVSVGLPGPETLAGLIEAEEDAQEDRERKELISGLADQLGNPLAALLGRLQLLDLYASAEQVEDLREQLEHARASSERLSQALRKLRLLASEEPIQGRPIEVLPVLQRLIGRFRSGALRPPEASTEEEQRALPTLKADDEVLEEALQLLVQALLALATPDASVSPILSVEGEGICLRLVLDTAIPFPGDEASFFRPFQHNDVLRDPDAGLDLALARKLLLRQSLSVQVDVRDGLLLGLVLRPKTPATG